MKMRKEPPGQGTYWSFLRNLLSMYSQLELCFRPFAHGNGWARFYTRGPRGVQGSEATLAHAEIYFKIAKRYSTRAQNGHDANQDKVVYFINDAERFVQTLRRFYNISRRLFGRGDGVQKRRDIVRSVAVEMFVECNLADASVSKELALQYERKRWGEALSIEKHRTAEAEAEKFKALGRVDAEAEARARADAALKEAEQQRAEAETARAVATAVAEERKQELEATRRELIESDKQRQLLASIDKQTKQTDRCVMVIASKKHRTTELHRRQLEKQREDGTLPPRDSSKALQKDFQAIDKLIQYQSKRNVSAAIRTYCKKQRITAQSRVRSLRSQYYRYLRRKH